MMTDAVFDFKSIARKLNRQEQKAEFEAKNPKEEPAYLWPYGVAATPFELPDLRDRVVAGVQNGTEGGAADRNGPVNWARALISNNIKI